MFEEKKYLRAVLSMAGVLGYNPMAEPRAISQLAQVVHCLANIVFIVLDVLYLCFNFGNLTISTFSQWTESLVTAVQIIIKMITMIVYRGEMRQLLLTTETFWNGDDLIDAVIDDIQVTYTYLTTVSKSIFVGALLAWITYINVGLFSNDLIFFTYVPDRYWLTFNVVKGIQLVFASGCLFVFVGFDCMYMYMCYKCVAQLKMIKYKIETIADEDDDPQVELDRCIEQHTIVISFVKTMKRVYEPYFLVQYLMALMTYGVQMFQFKDTGAGDTKQMAKSIFYMLAVLIQFVGCYCILSQGIYDSMSAISEAVYNSKWYNGNVKLAKKLLNVLCVSQKEIGIKAGGIANINLAVLTNLFRASFSILTFLNTLEEK